MLSRMSNFAGPVTVIYKNITGPITTTTTTTTTSTTTTTTTLSNGGSLLFTPSNNTYLSASASTDWAVGTGDFTVEWYQYQTNNGNENYIFSLGTTNTLAGAIASGGGKLNFYIGGSRVMNPAVNGSIQTVWTYLSISRKSSIVYLHQDGQLIGSASNTTNVTDSTSQFLIGVGDPAGSTNDNFPGNLTNFRFIKGVGLYGSGTYSRPTSRLSATPETKLLLLSIDYPTLVTDSSGTGKLVTNNGVTASPLTPF